MGAHWVQVCQAKRPEQWPRFVNLDRMDEVKVAGPNEKSGDWAVLANHQGRHYLVVGGLDSREEAEEALGRMLGLELLDPSPAPPPGPMRPYWKSV